jgi:hypothetical protein
MPLTGGAFPGTDGNGNGSAKDHRSRHILVCSKFLLLFFKLNGV